MSSPFIAEIVMFAGNFAPRNWAFCDGQLLQIAQNTALFSLVGTTYGGNGQTTFALPDLRGRVPIHKGSGPGLPTYQLGESGGAPTVTLAVNNLPAHTHALTATTADGSATAPAAGATLAASTARDKIYSAAATNTALAPSGSTGGSQSFSNVQPFLAINFIIAIQGIFPSRN